MLINTVDPCIENVISKLQKGSNSCAVKLRFVLQLPAPSATVAPTSVAFTKICARVSASAVPPTANAATLAALMQKSVLGVVTVGVVGGPFVLTVSVALQVVVQPLESVTVTM